MVRSRSTGGWGLASPGTPPADQAWTSLWEQEAPGPAGHIEGTRGHNAAGNDEKD